MTKEEEQQRFLELSSLFNKNNAIKHIILLEQKIADYESSRVELPVKPEIAEEETKAQGINETGTICCGKPMTLAENGLVYECKKCNNWEYSSS